MFSFSRDDIYRYVAPLCNPAQLGVRIANYEVVRRACEAGEEVCAALPVQVHVEPSGDCTLTCARCPRGAGRIARRGALALDVFRRVFEPLADTLANVVVSGWGEPLLNPETPTMVRHAVDAGVAVFLNTNGTLLAAQAEALVDSGLSRLTVALDGASSSGCHSYSEPYPFADVLRGVRAMRDARDRLGVAHPAIVGLFVITEADSPDVARLGDWALSIGADEVQFKRMHLLMPGERTRERVPADDALTRSLEERGAESGERLSWSPTGCAHPWESLFLACTGEVAVCSFDPYLHASLGTAADGVPALWNGRRLREMRRSHTPRGPELRDPCASCNRVPGYFRLRGARR